MTNGVSGILVKLLRRAHLLDAAPVQHDHLVGDFERLLLVVGHEEARDVNLIVQPPQPGPQLFADLGIEGRRTARPAARPWAGGASARASATRWRWPPESCEG